MEGNNEIPTALKVVAILFMINGVFAGIDIILSLLQAAININLCVLCFFVGRGLLKLRPGWRTCGLVFLWIGMILIPIITVIVLAAAGPGELDIKFMGQKIGGYPKLFVLLPSAIGFLLCLWQYRVLVRDDIRILFGLGPRQY